jgi:alpha-tubulin suppressor-like RCC1 family protein
MTTFASDPRPTNSISAQRSSHSLSALALAVALSSCASGTERSVPRDDADVPIANGSQVCGNGVIESEEFCDIALALGDPGACPASCDDDNRCTEDKLKNAATRICRSVCEYRELTNCISEDGCCPAGCDAARDSDCSANCGNGTVEPTETCDTGIAAGQTGACVKDCDDGIACTDDLLLSEETCHATCVHHPIEACRSGDGCCPDHCSGLNDSDCGSECGNGVVEPAESCDTQIADGEAGSCPQSCDDGDVCTTDVLEQGGSCTAQCRFTRITQCTTGDGCCPVGCSPAADGDCDAVCGNGTVDAGETCDEAIAGGAAGSCPSTCDDGQACTRDVLRSGDSCYARCEFTPISGCGAKDGCCPAGCNAETDDDCSPSCGNGVVEGQSEICDTDIAAGEQGACPTVCESDQACTSATLLSGGTCSAKCVLEQIEACSHSDGCCPAGCNALSDNDCEPVCGNAVVEPDELCDTDIPAGQPGSCPTSCEADGACLEGVVQAAGTCNATCAFNPVSTCEDDDGCCPANCDASSDADCRVNVVAGGESFSCAATVSGNAYCWGDNNYGQLGTGNTEDVYEPTAISTLRQVAAFEAAERHVCARTRPGKLFCWGYGSYGQLGLGDTSGSQQPRQVIQMDDGVTDAAVGERHSCAVKGGALWCWGDNRYGQLGLGDTDRRQTPTKTIASAVTQVAAGSEHTCAIVGGSVQCWGNNNYGQLGLGLQGSTVPTPRSLPTLEGEATAIAAGEDHTCAIVDGGLYCWGYNGYGNLGTGNTTQQLVPHPVTGLSENVVEVSCGTYSTCARRSNGEVLCFGRDNYGQIGNGPESSSNVTEPELLTLRDVAAIDAGGYHACAATAAGALHCWGNNQHGQLGNGFAVLTREPTEVGGLAGITEIAAGTHHTCAADAAGTVSCWGYNGNGQVGSGNTQTTALPNTVSGISGAATMLTAGNENSCALVSNRAYCWGDNNYGQLGTGSTGDQSSPVPSLTDIRSIANGSRHSCAVSTLGAASCWGYARYGQLGDGGATTSSTTYTPVAVVGLSSGVLEVFSQGFDTTYGHTCALLNGGAMKCWGEGSSGQLGSGFLSDANTPQDVVGLSDPSTANVSQIALGRRHTCAIDGGTLKCWGYNSEGQLGLGHQGQASIPQSVALPAQAQTVAAGSEHTCAITSAGALLCWGNNDYGQVGQIDASEVNDPHVVFENNVTAIGLGYYHTCAVHQNRLKCWGYNLHGQLGLGLTGREDAPVRVIGF